MSDTPHSSETVEVVPQEGGHSGEHQAGVLDVSFWMVLLTWVVFISVTVFLYKIAWKPILAVLAKREETIKKSLDDAEQARKELADTQAKSKQMLADVEARSREMMHNAKTAAGDIAAIVEKKAKKEAAQMLANAHREISGATERARASLRKESAELAIGLASRIVAENLDDAKNKALVQKYLKEV